MEIIIIILMLAILLITVITYKFKTKNKYYEQKYAKIINIDNELQKLKGRKKTLGQDIRKLQSSYKEKKIIFNKLTKSVAIYDEEIELAELGFYKPHFDFDSSEKYKLKITQIKNHQKELITSKEAIFCTKEWTVEGSKAKGRTMTNRGIRLTARAFNNECDAAIGKTSWNNVERLEQRLEKAFTAINKLNNSNAINISPEYLNLKIQELRLTHEYKEKRQQEKEEQAAIKRQMREEAKLEQEMQKALKDEEKYQKLLNKAKANIEKTTGAKLVQLQAIIAQLDKELTEAHKKSERAKSMAQQTKLGHIYIISNIGSFGENVYKIGMTRRLNPIDRVKELGDASVPFIFDVHAMIYAEDAPALEKKLHNVFNLKRVNLVNSRKEFFNVSLSEIENEVKKISPNTEFVETAEARHYKESQAIRAQQKLQSSKTNLQNKLPEEI